MPSILFRDWYGNKHGVSHGPRHGDMHGSHDGQLHGHANGYGHKPVDDYGDVVGTGIWEWDAEICRG